VVAPFVQAEIESVGLVPGCAQERSDNGSDATAIARNENPHR
jgi:hypothetical protein